jgi:chromosome partitioning protein
MGKRAAELSDLVLIPTRTSLADMDAVPTSHAMAKAAGKPHFVLFSGVDVSGAKRDVKEAAAGFVARGIPTGREHGAPIICHRKGYKSCLIDGSTIQEIEPDGKGAEEVDALFRWVAKQVGIKVKRKRTEKQNG